eukprot:TRINITY_DN21191_c0_g1_i1.p1 TRINITY_DN21191_c0_g1~~TRINITY_DN21191_c0_g1_i1.p1  ORF type:complete len:848 (+),score=186.53 TRINITY_DN21191_c0_g1_i1:421-2964(+)
MTSATARSTAQSGYGSRGAQGAPGGALEGSLRPAAVSKGYNFQSTWEQNAPLTEEQLSTIALLAQVAGDRAMPPHLQAKNRAASGGNDESSAAAPRSGDEDDENEEGRSGDLVLLNSHQFYKWHSDLEAAMKLETEEKYRQYVGTLTLHQTTCDEILVLVASTLSLFEDLQMQHRAVASKTKSLHDACQRLVVEKERLIEFADGLRSKLNYFDELEKIQTKFHGPTMSVTSSHFLPLLKRLDECISYVGSNLQYKDSDVYLKKFRHLQSRALGMVRSHALSVLRTASAQVHAAIRENIGAAASAAAAAAGAGAAAAAVSVTGGPSVVQLTISEGAETSLLYVRFKAAAGELKALMEEMEARAGRREYAQLLNDCHTVYCEQRLSLVQGVVQLRIADYARKDSLPALTRSGCAYLMQVCQLEHQLFDNFFPSSSAESSNLAPLIDPLCLVLYDTLRPRFIHEANDLEMLCELVDILKAEILDEQLQRRGETAAGLLRPTILRALADVQERLTFRAQTFMRDEIANFVGTAEDLDYPNKLQQAMLASGGASEEEDGRDAYALWYPPLEKTLACLSKLYRCVDTGIFTGLAQEAVGVCSQSIQRASKTITRKASPMDGQLFMIKHLLILREQIAPFDIEFAVTVREMDFTHLVDHLRRIFRGQASFFTLTNSTSLARLSPRVTESMVDAKKDLEKILKMSCEQFIMSVTKLTVEPLLSFITKVTAVRVTSGTANTPRRRPDGAGAAEGGGGSGVRPLREQAFATPEKVAEMVMRVDEALKVGLPEVVEKMRLYLQNSGTQAILFKPVKSNMMEAHGQVLALIQQEYTEADQAIIKLMPPNELQAYLDSLA